jgi:hypothetical protein
MSELTSAEPPAQKKQSVTQTIATAPQTFATFVVQHTQGQQEKPLQNMTLSPECVGLLTPILKRFRFNIERSVPIESKFGEDKRQYTLVAKGQIKRFLLQMPDTILKNPLTENINAIKVLKDLFLENFPGKNIKWYVFSPSLPDDTFDDLMTYTWPRIFKLEVKFTVLSSIMGLANMPEKRKEERVRNIFDLPELPERLQIADTITQQIQRIEETLNNVKGGNKIQFNEYSIIIINKLLKDLLDVRMSLSEHEKILQEIEDRAQQQTTQPNDVQAGDTASQAIEDKLSHYRQDILPNFEYIVEELLSNAENANYSVTEAKKKMDEAKRIGKNLDYTCEPVTDFEEKIRAYVEPLLEAANEGLRCKKL